MGPPKFPKVNGYDLVSEIGGGGFSTVYRAVNIPEHRVAACKLVRFTDDTTEKERKTVEKEMRVHTALKHKHVLEFLHAVIVELKHRHIYHPGIYMLLELAGGGDLFDKIAADVGLDEDVAQLYFNQLVSGMSYIHAQGVCHRDLKPENLLLDAAGTLKISDFGLSAVFCLKESGKTRLLTERCGSLPYVAPELNSEDPYKAEPVDVWGVGVILYTLLCGNTPWDEPTAASPEFCRYVSGRIFIERPWNRIPSEPMSLIKGMLTVDPEKRMTLDAVAAHPWCMRQSQLASQGLAELASRLTESIHQNGEMNYAAPPTLNGPGPMDTDDEDTIMQSAPNHQSQFTQTLMLFSQTQSGARYTPHLTRFYASLGPALLMGLIHEALEALSVKCKIAPAVKEGPGGSQRHRLRIGGWDKRRQMFKGWVEVERFTYRGAEGSFCVMRRDEGNPISWRQLWKALIESQAVEPHVLRK
ncbi:CAMK CAMKL CHK1 protein kinase [Pholiota conissans]|uniref:CAMK CAMKL CHK1 protein kinase n=1 Tax=Pholiota conissans TaxID=109636 RepID=A0A9P5Z7C2_9AGAR|nr:CAMK CAMKL CHK1 protein kinase [Pholiota conissans]